MSIWTLLEYWWIGSMLLAVLLPVIMSSFIKITDKTSDEEIKNLSKKQNKILGIFAIIALPFTLTVFFTTIIISLFK